MNKKGYTLVELIITLAVVSIMIVPIFNAFLESNRINQISKRHISSAYLAQTELEHLKSLSQSDLDLLDGLDPLDPLVKYSKSNGSTEFNIRVEVVKESDLLAITVDDSIAVSGAYIPPVSDVTINIPLLGNGGTISFDDTNASSLNFDTSLLDFNSLISTQVGTEVTLTLLGQSEDFTPSITGEVSVNVVGPGDALWLIKWQNTTTDHILKVYPIDNYSNNILSTVDGDVFSLSEIIIYNNHAPVIGEVSQPMELYRVVIYVEYDGVVYETLESTIGK